MFLWKVIASEGCNIRKEVTIYFPGKFTTIEGSITRVNTEFSENLHRQFILFKKMKLLEQTVTMHF